jgi:alpha-beta hydrolase superfamily lysophospholipase
MSILEYLFACFEDLVDKSSKTSRMNAGLVEYVERTVRSERSRAPDRPVYIVGDSVGACIALAVAARNQDIDLVLILVNPGLASFVHGF